MQTYISSWAILSFGIVYQSLFAPLALAESGQILDPRFKIEVVLTEAAKLKLSHSKETILVSAKFAESLGSHSIELTKPGVAAFENISFPEEKVKSLKKPDYVVVVNVTSGAKGKNLLACSGFVQGSIHALQNKTFQILCDFISNQKGQFVSHRLKGTNALGFNLESRQQDLRSPNGIYFQTAQKFYVQGRYSQCLEELSKMSAAYKTSQELRNFCEQGRQLVSRQARLPADKTDSSAPPPPPAQP